MKYLFKLPITVYQEVSVNGQKTHQLVQSDNHPTLTLVVNAEDAENAAYKLQRAINSVLLAGDSRLFYIHDR